MGSLDRAILTGFVCRLCSEMDKYVLHLYGQECTRLCVTQKIHRYLSLSVSPSDPLPKTICNRCVNRLENQHQLISHFKRAAELVNGRV